jgi:hypothetical protein
VRQSGPVTDYLAVLGRELDFDPTLSRRVRIEVEDHLWQAVEARGRDSLENQLHAILRFGDPRALARQYVAAALLARIRRVGAAMVLAAGAIFLAMKARVAWYAWMRWEASPDFKALSALALPIDRYATMLAIAFALIGCAYIATRRAPARCHLPYRKQLTRCIVLCGAAALALSVSVATETVLTGIRLSGAQWCAAAAVPVLSLGVELAAVVGFVLAIQATIRRTALAASRLRD